MHGTSAFRLPGLEGSLAGPAEHVSVGLVNLLGVRVSTHAVLDQAEHARRRSVGMAAVTDPALLGRLLEVPSGQPVVDAVMWAETAGQPAGVVARGDDGHTVTRLLEPALIVHDVIVPGRRGRELLAVQQASLFAGSRRTCLPTTCARPAGPPGEIPPGRPRTRSPGPRQ
jgi:hypothetical protein